MIYRNIYKPHIPYVDMGLKEFIHRLFPRPYMVLDKRGVSRLLSHIDFFKEGKTFLISFLNNYNQNPPLTYRLAMASVLQGKICGGDILKWKLEI